LQNTQLVLESGMIKKMNDSYWAAMASKIAAIVLFSFGLTFLKLPFWNTVSFLTGFLIILEGFYPTKVETPPTKELQVSDLQKFEELLQEKDEVINSYEVMLDEQVVSIDCNCGSTLFKGILIPNAENICKCAKCAETYKVFVSYDSVLVADPLTSDAVFDKLRSIEPESIN
jgi:hypothetical protein